MPWPQGNWRLSGPQPRRWTIKLVVSALRLSSDLSGGLAERDVCLDFGLWQSEVEGGEGQAGI
jgi:hypothetical protein